MKAVSLFHVFPTTSILMKDNYGLNKAMHVAITSLPITAEYFIYRKLDSGSQVLDKKDQLLKVKPLVEKLSSQSLRLIPLVNRISSEATVLLAVGIGLIKDEDSIACLN